MDCACGKKAAKYCSRCGVQRYCSVECQRADWPAHKQKCSPETHTTREDLEKTALRFHDKVTGESPIVFRFPRSLGEMERAAVKVLMVEGRLIDQVEEERRHLRSCWRRKLLAFDHQAMAAFAAAGDQEAVGIQIHVGSWFNAGARPEGGCSIDQRHVIVYRDSQVLPEIVFWKIFSNAWLPEPGKRPLLPLTGRDILFDHRAKKEPIGLLLLSPVPSRPTELLDWDNGRRLMVESEYAGDTGKPDPSDRPCLEALSEELVQFARQELRLDV